MNHFLRLLMLPTALAFGIVHCARGQEWTRFRGPNGSGISDTSIFPAKWEAKDFRWKIELPGGGHSSPVVWGDKVFVTCADDQSGKRMVVCVGASSGKILWTREFGGNVYAKHMDNSYASSTPALDADRVYVCWSTPEEFSLVALDHDGKDAWKADLGPFVSQHGGGQSPIVVGDLVLLGDDQEGQASFVFGIDRATGKVAWRTPRVKSNKFCPATPCVYTPQGGEPQAIFLSKAEGVTAIDPKNGKVLWQAKDVLDARAVGSPVIAGDLIIGSCGDGPIGHDLVAVRPGGAGKAATGVWHTRDSTPYVTTTLVKHDLLFCWGDSGLVTCRRPATGEQVWQQRVPGGAFYSSPICCGDTIFNITKKGEVVAIAAKDKYELLGQTPLNEKCQATPAVAEGKMYVRTYSHLYCVGGKSLTAVSR
ncbi:MAG: Pyrrolo-quinoline quinone [Phycisphaerales bacterium]|nr:Pyrrolo-quinoline quinone [Phycisphaerales bacterium]MDB5353692.1 Pyrrolo-quinoline quinone [Phycisphaerales bacterium]